MQVKHDVIDSRRVKGVNHFNKVFVFFSMERFSHFIKYEVSVHVIKFSRERSVMIVQRNASVKSKRRVQESRKNKKLGQERSDPNVACLEELHLKNMRI